MPVVTFTKEDVRSAHLIEEPAWVKYEIKKVNPKAAKSDGSTNYWVTFIGLEGEMEGVLVTELWNVKAPWSMVSLYRAVNNGQDPKEGDVLKFEELVNIKLEGYTSRGDKFGTNANCIKDYRPLQ